MKAEVEQADATVRELMLERRSQLDRTILATETQIEWQKTARHNEATARGTKAKSDLSEVFWSHREDIEKSIALWTGYAETLRTFHTARVQQDIAANVKEADRQAEMYWRIYIRYQSRGAEGRGAVQRDAAFAVARALAKEFQKSEPELIAAIATMTTQIANDVRAAGNQVFADFDEALPPLLLGIDEQVAAAQADIARKAREAQAKLVGPAQELRDRLAFLEREALARNAAIRAKIDRQIDTGRSSADRQFRRAVPQAMKPISGVVGGAAEIFATADTLDPDASWQFVDEVVEFTRGAAEETGAVFLEARTSVADALNRPAPAARRALTAVQNELATILRTEGVAAEFALTDYAVAVDDNYGATITALDKTFVEAKGEATRKLAPAVKEVQTALRTALYVDAAPQIRDQVKAALYKQILGLRGLERAMHGAAREAAWRYDHPRLKYVVDAVEFALEFAAILFVAITVVFALILAFKAILAGLVAFLALFVGQMAATLILAFVGGAALGYFGARAYEERVAKGQSGGAAFLGAVADISGLTAIRSGLTDDSLTIAERGMRIGVGLFSVLALGGARLLRAIKIRLPSRFTDPRGAAPPLPAKPAPPPGMPTPAPVPSVTPAKGPISFELPNAPPPAPTPAIPPAPTPAIAPAKGPIGFDLPTAAPRAPVPIDVPPPLSPRVTGFVRKIETPPPRGPAPQEPPVMRQMPPARMMPSSSSGQGVVGSVRPAATGQRFGQPTKAMAGKGSHEAPKAASAAEPGVVQPPKRPSVAKQPPSGGGAPPAKPTEHPDPWPKQQGTRPKPAEPQRLAERAGPKSKGRVRKIFREGYLAALMRGAPPDVLPSIGAGGTPAVVARAPARVTADPATKPDLPSVTRTAPVAPAPARVAVDPATMPDLPPVARTTPVAPAPAPARSTPAVAEAPALAPAAAGATAVTTATGEGAAATIVTPTDPKKAAKDAAKEKLEAKKAEVLEKIEEAKEKKLIVYSEIEEANQQLKQRLTNAQKEEIRQEKADLAREANRVVIPEENRLIRQYEDLQITQYERARAYSYSDSAARAVLSRSGGLDEISLTKPSEPSIDHVVSIEEMSTYEGFDELVDDDLHEVLSLLQNLRLMEKARNSSKQSKRWVEWAGGLRLYGEPAWRRMVDAESDLRVEIKKLIKRLVAKRKRSTH